MSYFYYYCSKATTSYQIILHTTQTTDNAIFVGWNKDSVETKGTTRQVTKWSKSIVLWLQFSIFLVHLSWIDSIRDFYIINYMYDGRWEWTFAERKTWWSCVMWPILCRLLMKLLKKLKWLWMAVNKLSCLKMISVFFQKNKRP